MKYINRSREARKTDVAGFIRKIAAVAFIICTLTVMLSACSDQPQGTSPSTTVNGTGESTVSPETTKGDSKVKDNQLEGKYDSSVKVTDPFGNNFSDNAGGELISSLLKMTKNAERTVYLSFAVDASKYYTAVFSGPKGEVTYKFFFSSSPEECFFESGMGRYYKANKDGCIDFFNSKYSEGAYFLANYPEFKMGNNLILPATIEWQYKRYDGVYKTPDFLPQIKDKTDVGNIAANIKFAFSAPPTSINVKVVDLNGKELYNGPYSGFCNIPISTDVDVNITVDALWEKSNDTFCAGKATYNIKAKLGPSAVFDIDRTTAKLGEFLILTCPNTSVDLNEIKVKTDPELDYEPVFYSDGAQLKALIPIPLTTQVKNGITITVTAYGSKQDFHIAITERKNVSSYTVSMISADTLNILGVTADPYEKIYADIEAEIKQNTTFSRVYKHSDFDIGFPDGTLRARFGDNVKYSPLGATVFPSHDYSWIGTFYQKITAVSDGRVVYVGEHDYTGGLVVIDHGMGLLSWYWNLSTISITVGVGDEVKQGHILGNNGGGGLSENYNSTNISVHIGLTVFDVPVDIGQLLKD